MFIPLGFCDPQATTKGAVCLDGSPGMIYHRKGVGDGANKWYIHHQGGGWCESLDDCLGRSKTRLGSSKTYAPTSNPNFGYFSTSPLENPMMYNCKYSTESLMKT